MMFLLSRQGGVRRVRRQVQRRGAARVRQVLPHGVLHVPHLLRLARQRRLLLQGFTLLLPAGMTGRPQKLIPVSQVKSIRNDHCLQL